MTTRDLPPRQRKKKPAAPCATCEAARKRRARERLVKRAKFDEMQRAIRAVRAVLDPGSQRQRIVDMLAAGTEPGPTKPERST